MKVFGSKELFLGGSSFFLLGTATTSERSGPKAVSLTVEPTNVRDKDRVTPTVASRTV